MQRLVQVIVGLLMLGLTATLTTLWVGLCAFLPFKIGQWLNRVVLRGRTFSAVGVFFGLIAGAGLLCTFVLIMGAAILQIFSLEASDWWYTRLFPVGAVGNTIGILCAGVAGLLSGRESMENGE